MIKILCVESCLRLHLHIEDQITTKGYSRIFLIAAFVLFFLLQSKIVTQR